MGRRWSNYPPELRERAVRMVAEVRADYPPELRERAVRMVAEVRADYPSEWPAIVAVAEKMGTGMAETLRK